MRLIQQPVLQWVNPTKNTPVAQGFMYFGVVGQDPKIPANQITVFRKNQLNEYVEVQQPISLSDSGVPIYLGQEMTLYVEQDCAIRVDDRNGLEQYLIRQYFGAEDDTLRADLADGTADIGGQTAQSVADLRGEVEGGSVGVVQKYEQTGTPDAGNFGLFIPANTIDPATEGSSIWGVGWITQPNKIGSASKPTGTDWTNPSEWPIDSGYLSATINNASVAVISGGYDHINNQIAGTIGGGGHNYIQYNAEGHSFIGGGSYNWIQSGRATILAGTNNRVSGDTYNQIYGGFTNKILSGGHNTILGGELNIIDTPGFKFNIIYGQNNQITGSGRYCAVFGVGSSMVNSARSIAMGGENIDHSGNANTGSLGGTNVTLTNCSASFSGGGENSTMTGCSYSASIGGQGNTQTGRSSAMLAAENCNDNGARGTFTGRRAQGMGAYYQSTIGCAHPTTSLVSQAMRVAQGATTTGTSLNAPAEQQIIVGNTGLTTITGSVLVTARNTTDSKTAGYKVDFVAQWNGTTYFLNGVTADLAMDVVYEEASSNITAPVLAFSAGQLRVRFGGTASKTINWSAVIDCSLMRG